MSAGLLQLLCAGSQGGIEMPVEKSDGSNIITGSKSINLSDPGSANSVRPASSATVVGYAHKHNTRDTPRRRSSNAGGQGIHFNRLRRRPKSKPTKQSNKTRPTFFCWCLVSFALLSAAVGGRGAGVSMPTATAAGTTPDDARPLPTARCVVSARFFVCTPLVFPLSAFKRSAPTPLPKTPQTYTTRTHKR